MYERLHEFTGLEFCVFCFLFSFFFCWYLYFSCLFLSILISSFLFSLFTILYSLFSFSFFLFFSSIFLVSFSIISFSHQPLFFIPFPLCVFQLLFLVFCFRFFSLFFLRLALFISLLLGSVPVKLMADEDCESAPKDNRFIYVTLARAWSSGGPSMWYLWAAACSHLFGLYLF